MPDNYTAIRRVSLAARPDPVTDDEDGDDPGIGGLNRHTSDEHP